MTEKARIVKFGSITDDGRGGLVFQGFHIEGPNEFNSQAELVLQVVIDRLQSELDSFTRVHGNPFTPHP